MTSFSFNVLSCAFLFQYFLFTKAKEEMIGSALVNRKFTFEDAKRVFIDVEHRLPNGGKLLGFSMYVRPIPNYQRDHYARFCIWTKLSYSNKTAFKLKYQTAARLPRQEGIFTTRIDDNVLTTDNDYFGVTFEQNTGTITREVDARGKLMFSDQYDNLPNTNDEIVIVQENYLNVMSMQAIIDDGASVTCNSGFARDNRGNCIDINECLNNNGGCDQNCINNDGSFECGCRSGYSLQSNGRTCANVNECLNNNGGCDHNCNYNENSFKCTCRSGYSLQSNGRTCRESQAQHITGPDGMTGATGQKGPEGPRGPPGPPGDFARDTDECPTARCQHSCVNTFGSFYCQCDKGYSLNVNGRNCDNINECSINNGLCDHTCEDANGSHRCRCRSGYRLSLNNHNCIDIDECEEKNPCGSETCVNTIGGYRCVELRFLNDVSGYQDDFRYAKASVSVPFADKFKLNSEKDNTSEDNKLASTDLNVIVWLGALSVLMALLVGTNILFCRKRSKEERQRLTESTSDHSVTEIELEDIDETHIRT